MPSDTSDRYTHTGPPREELQGYTIANGIGRHESVAEEEVARRVYMALNTGVQE